MVYIIYKTMQSATQLDHTTQECFAKHRSWYYLNTVLLNMPQETTKHNQIWNLTRNYGHQKISHGRLGLMPNNTKETYYGIKQET